MADLIYMMNSLLDKDGNILVEGIQNDVEPLTPAEEALYDSIEFDPEDFRKDLGTKKLIHPNNKNRTLMSRWRYPSLSLHGIEGAFSDPGEKNRDPYESDREILS